MDERRKIAFTLVGVGVSFVFISEVFGGGGGLLGLVGAILGMIGMLML